MIILQLSELILLNLRTICVNVELTLILPVAAKMILSANKLFLFTIVLLQKEFKDVIKKLLHIASNFLLLKKDIII